MTHTSYLRYVLLLFYIYVSKSSSFKASLEGTLSTALEALAKMCFSMSQFNGELCFYKTVSPDTNCHTYHTKIFRREGDEKRYPPSHKPLEKTNQNQQAKHSDV